MLTMPFANICIFVFPTVKIQAAGTEVCDAGVCKSSISCLRALHAGFRLQQEHLFFTVFVKIQVSKVTMTTSEVLYSSLFMNARVWRMANLATMS